MTAVPADGTGLVPPPRYRPAMLPRERAKIVTDMATLMPGVFADYIKRGQQTVYPPAIMRARPTPSVGQIAQFMAAAETERITRASLYYVAPEMTALAMTAGADLPDYEFAPTDLPSEYGLMWFDGPVPETYDEPWHVMGAESPAYLMAVAWGPIRDPDPSGARDGVWFSFYSDRDLGDRDAVALGLLTPESVLQMVPLRPHVTYDNESMIYYGASWQDCASEVSDGNGVIAAGQRRVGPRLIRTALAASLLMRQPLAEVVDARDTYSRHERKRLHRDGLDDDVRLVHLRQRPRRDTGGGEHREVEWSCQWPVKGHWKQVAYGPDRALRRPTYIAPFIKGPVDKPLRLRETVRVWDR